MKQRFKLIRIDAYTGEAVLLKDNLSENKAFDESYDRELIESKKPDRHYWYAVTPLKDWQSLAREFIRYRRDLVFP
jgi:hypothetical protein